MLIRGSGVGPPGPTHCGDVGDLLHLEELSRVYIGHETLAAVHAAAEIQWRRARSPSSAFRRDCSGVASSWLRMFAAFTGDKEMLYEFLIDTYDSERIKVVSVWSEFTDDDLPVRPRPDDSRGRSVHEQMGPSV